jgi:hypothetical protein
MTDERKGDNRNGDGSSSVTLEPFDELIQQLRVEGYVEPAARLHTLLHEVAWTTGSELFGEVGLTLLAFERSAPVLGIELQGCFDRCMTLVRRVWPDIQ